MIVNYANYLAQQGHNVAIYLSFWESVFTLHDDIEIVKVLPSTKGAFLAFGAMHRFEADMVIVDIIHLPLLVGLCNRVVYFAQADDIEYYDNNIARHLMDFLYRIYLRKGAVVITVDNRLTETFKERYGYSACHTVTNGIELDKFYPEPDRELLNKKAGRKALFFMARGDHFRKGFDLAVEVFKRIDAGTAAQMELWVCGEQMDDTRFPFMVRNFGIVSDDRLRQLLSSADIFFYPSRHEGFGLFPLEAMACGCVVLTTEAVPYANKYECIVTTDIGNIDAMVNQIKGLLLSPVILERMQQDAVLVARLYDIRKSCEQFVASLYEIRSEVS